MTTGPPLVVTGKSRWWEDAGERQVVLKPSTYGTDEWEVYRGDECLGTVTRYIGSLDRHIPGTRLRSEGKRRTLWAYRDQGSRHSMWDQYSRADCIRALLDRRR